MKNVFVSSQRYNFKKKMDNTIILMIATIKVDSNKYFVSQHQQKKSTKNSPNIHPSYAKSHFHWDSKFESGEKKLNSLESESSPATII